MKRFVLYSFGLILTLIPFHSFEQNSETFFKVIPTLSGDEPLWVSKMYEANPNVREVVDLYYLYYQTNPFVKTIHTQNFKYWLGMSAEYVQADGFIHLPAPEVERARIQTLHESRYNHAPSRTSSWTNIGPDRTYKNNGTLDLRPTQVNIFAMAVAPSDHNMMYGAAEGGGIFFSTDHGLNWELTSGAEVFTNAQDIKVHPTNANIVYVASGVDVYKTLDGGITWNLMHSFAGTIEQFYIHRDSPNRVYAATSSGLFLTTDSGATWSLLLNKRCWDIEAHVIDANILFLSVNNAAAKRAEIFKSLDGGVTWELKDTDWYVPTAFGSASDIGCKIAVTAADPDRIYTCLIGDSKAGDNGWIGVYYSENGGESWINPDGIDGGPYVPGDDMATNWFVAGYADGYHQGWYNFDLEASPTDADKIWIGTIWFCESGNRGANIEYVRGTRSLEMHADIQDIDVVGTEVWIASDGGLNYSADECLTVEVRNTGISASTFWGFTQGWNEDTWTGGRYHNGDAVYHENFGMGNTMFMGGAEQATGYVNPLNNRETHYSDISDKFTPDALGISSSEAPNFSIYPNESYSLLNSSEVEYDPRYANHLYLGNENKFYKSTDGGASFDVLFEFPAFSRVLEFEVSRQNPAVIYAVVRDGFICDLYKSVDGGNNFVMTTAIDAPSLSLMDLTINPLDANELWVALYYGVTGQKVYQTLDGGSSWINKTTASLNGQNIRDIVFQGGSDHVVYVVSNYALFYWNNSASEWMAYDEDLPFVTQALHMRPFYRDSKLRLSGGRGIWEASFAQPSDLPIAQPMTKSDQIYCSRDTVQFECYSIIDHEGATWLWSFSPAPAYVSSATARNPKVVFNTEGSYDVTLTVTNGDGVSSTETVEDMVTLTNQCSPDPIPGLAMRCYTDGDYAQTPDLNIGETNHFSVSAWVKPNGIQPEYTGIVFNDNASAGLNFRPSNQLAYHWPGGAWWWDSGLFVEADVWSHVALVVTPDSITVYLNGVPSSHLFTVDPVMIETMKLGSYKGWGGRNYNGVMDEVCIWNKALTQDEIRELRHLTRTGLIDYSEDLVAYYQFNIPGVTTVNDRIGTNHAVLSGGAEKIVSTAPVGGGNSDRIYVSGGGEVIFPNSETTIEFAAGTSINGEIVVTRIHLEPDSLPSTNPNTGNYWVINNYGEVDFTELTAIHFTVNDATPAGLPENALLFTRSENEELNNWEERCAAINFDGGLFNYDATCEIGQFSQFYIESDVNDGAIVVDVPSENLLDLLIYPNPTQDLIYIQFEAVEALNFDLFDQAGRLVVRQTLRNSGEAVNLGLLASGIYTIRVENITGVVYTTKLVKQ